MTASHLPCHFASCVCGMDDFAERMRSLWNVVGDTPLLQIRCRYLGSEFCVYAKYEAENLTGSIKDRMALHILEGAYAEGQVRRGDEIVEVTSGNTGISFAALGRALGHTVRIYMPTWMSAERRRLIEAYGALVVPVTERNGGFMGAIAMADDYAARTECTFRPRQFENEANVVAHRETTGPEILAQLRGIGLEPTGFVAGVGTGGTLMGVGEFLRDELGAMAVHPLEPANSPTLRTGHKHGSHRIQGISDEFVPSIVDLPALDSIVDVWDGDAILMAQRLARELGLGVGISSGANLLGAIQIAHAQGPAAVVATVFPDSNKKYLSTDLWHTEHALDMYLSPRVELAGVRFLARAGGRKSPVVRCGVA